MGLLDFFSRQQTQFVKRESFDKNFAKQSAMAPMTLGQLRKCEVTQERQLRLEFFFYTNTPEKAQALTTALLRKEYEAAHWPSASDKKLRVISGWTHRMPMHDSTVLAWTREMCQIGFDHDCEFDGWGTNPDQPDS